MTLYCSKDNLWLQVTCVTYTGMFYFTFSFPKTHTIVHISHKCDLLLERQIKDPSITDTEWYSYVNLQLISVYNIFKGKCMHTYM